MKTYKEYLAESGGGLSRVLQHTKERNIGMITAHRGVHTPEENKERNELLKADIKDNGYGYKHVKGVYVENHGKADAKPVEEHSFLVIGKKGNDSGALKGFLKKHGTKYDQDSILHKAHDDDDAHLIGTNDTGYPGKDKEANVGKFHPDRAGEFYSKLKGKDYTFESVEFYEPEYSKTFLNRAGSEEVLIESYRYDKSGKVIG